MARSPLSKIPFSRTRPLGASNTPASLLDPCLPHRASPWQLITPTGRVSLSIVTLYGVTLYATPVTRPMKPARGFSFQVRRVHEREAETPPSPLYSCSFSTWRARHERAHLSPTLLLAFFISSPLSLSLSQLEPTDPLVHDYYLPYGYRYGLILFGLGARSSIRPCVRNNFFASARLPHSLSSIAAITHTVAPPRVITLLYTVVRSFLFSILFARSRFAISRWSIGNRQREREREYKRSSSWKTAIFLPAE